MSETTDFKRWIKESVYEVVTLEMAFDGGKESAEEYIIHLEQAIKVLRLRIEELEKQLVLADKLAKNYSDKAEKLEAELVKAHSGQAYQAGKQDGIERAAELIEEINYENTGAMLANAIRALKESDK